MNPAFLVALTGFALVALGASYAGVVLSGIPELSRKVLPFSGFLLLVVSFAWVLPELANDFGWLAACGLMLAGFTFLAVIDRYVYPVCPSCSHTHDHDTCSTRLHGFAGPLVTAAVIHSFFDGWALAAAAQVVRPGIWAGVLLHKLPESLALGVILRAAMRTRSGAVMGAAFVQAAMVVGGVLEELLAPWLNPLWMHVLLAIAGGTFLYLGFHAVHGEWKRRRAYSH